MRYEGRIYRPPSEFDSLIIQATIGCPHNRCSFCNMYSDRKFRIRSVEDIIEDLDSAKEKYGQSIEKIFFSDGNTILMKTNHLLEILNHSNKLFPFLKQVTMYGSAQFINLKSLDEIIKLRQAGRSRIHCGMESGDDVVLKLMDKGFTRQEMSKAGNLIKNAGIELSLYYIVALGGVDLSHNHAVNSATLINEINPDFIRLRTLIPFKYTPISQMYKEGIFKLLNAHQAIRETKLFIETLDNIDSHLLSDHVSNYCNISGVFPDDKDAMFKDLDFCLSLDISSFRAPDSGRL